MEDSSAPELPHPLAEAVAAAVAKEGPSRTDKPPKEAVAASLSEGPGTGKREKPRTRLD